MSQSTLGHPESHSARYFALLYSAPTQHAILESLLKIEREILESLRPGLDHHVAHSRLQWWREECERTAAGQPIHPLTRTLVDTLTSGSAVGSPALTGLSGFVDVATWDLAGATFETRRELNAYCGRWSAAMSVGLAPEDWIPVGAAIREIELLGDLAREAHYGRVRLPLDELDGAGAEPGVLAKPPWPEGVAELLRARYQALRGEMISGLIRLDREQQPALRGLLVWAALAIRGSQRAEGALPDGWRPGKFDAISDAWFAWRIARQATTKRLRLT